MSRFDENERPTNPTHAKPGARPQYSDPDYRLGQLMVEMLNHRRRLEVIEAEVNHSALTKSVPPPRQSLFVLARKTLTTTLVIFAAIISTLKELGFLH